MKNIKTITTAIVLLFAVTMTFARTTITMEKDGGVYKVPCVVNGLRMKFIFDTGAANVCISESMATYMLENDYLNKSDILGTGQSSVADGRIVDHVKIRLSTLEIGGIKLYDVEAVVITGQSSPLLLGQSAITKIGKVSVNGNQLIIEDAGGCSQADIDEWGEKAETYFKREVYAKALEFYLKVDDCDFLSDWGRYRLANCYHELDKYEQALEVYESLIRKIDNRTTELKFLDQIVLYINVADCYRRAGNIKASIYHNQIAESNLPDEEWELAAKVCYELAMCYLSQKDHVNADAYATIGIKHILKHKYPKVYSEWERVGFRNLGSVMGKYRWGREELMGNLIFVICDDYYNTMGSPHCQMIRIAAEMGSPAAQEVRNLWRSYGICQ